MGEFEKSPLGRVTIYSIQGCPHCVQAKATLGRLAVPVRDVDIGRHPELRARVKELTGRSTVPQIFFNGVHVGGNDDLQKLVRRGTTSKNSAGMLTGAQGCALALFVLPQDAEELQRLVNLVKEEPLPADAPPLPDDDQSESTTAEADGGERISWHHQTFTWDQGINMLL